MLQVLAPFRRFFRSFSSSLFSIFLLIRPQQKKMKQHKEMLGAIRRGDKIVTGGGIVGTVTKVIDDAEVMVEISEGVKVRVHRPLISSVLAKTEPACPRPSRRKRAPAEGTPDKAQQTSGSKLKKLFGGKTD